MAGILNELVEAVDYETGCGDLSVYEMQRWTPRGLRYRIDAALQELLDAGVIEQLGQAEVWRITAAPEWFHVPSTLAD